MFFQGTVATSGNMNPSGSTFVGWMSGSRTQNDWIVWLEASGNFGEGVSQRAYMIGRSGQ